MPFKQRSNEGCKIILSKVLYFGMFCAIFALEALVKALRNTLVVGHAQPGNPREHFYFSVM